jgi:UDP-N-acetylmuramoyl-tripeptide--D-alanyl-D-alanine ligase
VGTVRPGDFASIAKWLKPDIVVVTKLSKVPVHVEAFHTPEALFMEKGNLVRALKPGGALVLNADDEDVLAYRNLSEEEVILFGNATGSDMRASNYHIVYDEHAMPTGISFDIEALAHKKESEETLMPLTLKGTLGEHHEYHALAALCVCELLGEDLGTAVKALEKDEALPGRMHIVEGIKESLIIDDTYNSSPIALEKALDTLKNIKKKRGKRKIAVLGDMLELGRFSIDEHKKAGEHAGKFVDILITVGVRARSIAEGALNQEMDEANIFQFDDSEEAGMFLQNMIKPGDIILVKGSQGVRCERVVEEIMAHPEDKEKLLVRQDAEWQLRG